MNDNINRQEAIRDIRLMDVCVIYDDMCSTEEAVEKAIVATKGTAIFGLECMPSAEPKIIHCKDCRNRGEDECPMRHVERIEWEEDGYIEVDDIVHDYTEPYGYCDKGERNE